MNETLSLINNKYLIIKELNNGEFGKIYKAKHRMSNDKVVIKIEKKGVLSLLLYETRVYNNLKNYSFISKIRNFYNDEINNVLIIDYNGDTIYELKNNLINFNSRDKINIINKLIICIINSLEELHNLKYIHRDVKPHNFCYNNSLKVIDLGFCKPYIVYDKHIENYKLKNIIGTKNYISKNVLELNTPSRRDDIESVFYIYLFLLLPNDIWLKYSQIDSYNKKDIIINFEIISNINNDFYNNEINIELLKNFLIIVRNIKFDNIPPYNTLKTLIKSI